MIKLIIILLIILFDIKCNGKSVRVGVRIKDDWGEKREFNYLKNVDIKKRFVSKKIIKRNNQHDISY
ncbi:unnamed protein product [Meloidogyne enterolobii]|uniref:Uncharacterized protein n=1 Tax=Meloidogyne enterolobii TaxID=390850 RepID=A0ACB0Y5G9_MELEN